MKKFLAILGVLFCLAGAAIADTDLTRTPGSFMNSVAVQTFAPGAFVTALTVASSTIDLTHYLMYSVYSASGTCFMRNMATSAKGSYTAVPVPNTTWRTLAKNATTPFLNMSGCVGGYVQGQ